MAGASSSPLTTLPYREVDSRYLDCVDDNVAVLLKYAGHGDTRTPFACEWHFAFASATHTVAVFRTPIEDRIARWTPYRLVRERVGGDVIAWCRDRVVSSGPILLYGDAYFMPWLVYAGHQHIEHSFLVDAVTADDGVRIVDAYCNRTTWGDIRPTECWISHKTFLECVQTLETPMSATSARVERTDMRPGAELVAELRTNAAAMLAAAAEQGAMSAFVDAYTTAISDSAFVTRFVLDCWLAVRVRGLHALWLTDIAEQRPDIIAPRLAERFRVDVVSAWQRVNELAFLMQRRVSLGRSAPAGALDWIREAVIPAERKVAVELSEHLAVTTDSPR